MRSGSAADRGIAKLLGVAIFCASSFAVVGASADQVRTRAWAHDGFGRIVFDWPRDVGYTANIQNQSLRVVFDREIETDFRRVTQHLDAYISSVEVESDGRTVSAALKGSYRVRTIKSDSGVVVDLLPATDKPAQSAKSSESGDSRKVGVRVGEHAEYTRVVFDWTRSVEYDVKREGDFVIVSFNAPGAIDLSRLTSGRTPRISGAETQTDSHGSSVRLSVQGDNRLRHFRSGTKVVLDVLDAPRTTASREQGTSAESDARARQQTQRASEETPSARNKSPQESSQTENRRNAVSTGAGALSVEFKSTEADGVRIAIDGGNESAKAVFLRAGYVWTVFDIDAEASINDIPAALSETIFLAEQVDADGGTALRFKVRSGLSPTVSKEESGWSVELAENAPSLDTNIPVSRRESDGGYSAFASVENSGRVVEIADPEVGDTLFVVPVVATRHGVSPTREHVEFRILETAQGVAIAPLADHVRVSADEQGVVIDGEFGLALSVDEESGDEDEDVDVAELEQPAANKIFRYDDWLLGPVEEFQDIKQELQLTIANTPAADRNEKRWILARFYLSHGYAADTLGVLRLISEHNPRIVQELEFLTLRGASRFLMAHIDSAEENLFVQALDGEPEIALWRGAVYAEKQEWELARDEFVFGASVIDRFPVDIRSRFMLASAKVALEVEQFDMLDQDLTLLAAEDLAPKHQAQADLVRGQALELIGDEDGALEAYESSVDFGFRPTRARAEFARVNLLYKRQEISFEETVEGFEKLRFAWRGDDFEFNLLRRLGELYVEQGSYREGLSAMREAVTHFRDTPESRKLQEVMDTVFRNLFLDNEADGMEPVRALALYYDFRELTPVGKEGDLMIRQLADRLVGVDLLDRAAQLLEHQVKFRLRRGEKAQVGARLAAIHFMDKQPKKVLEVLKMSRWKPLPKEIVAERRYLEARAHAAMGKYQDALNSLVGEKSREARLIRSDIYWRSKDWVNASGTMQAILGERWKDDTPLADEERHHVMRLAVALSLADDRAAVQRVRKSYQALLQSTPDADAFEIVTRDVDPSTVEFRKVAAAVAQIDTLESFMSRYSGSEGSDQVEAVN